MIYLDTETCGLAGPMVLLQYAVDDGPIVLYNVWKNPISEVLEKIEWIVDSEICGFNLAFDWFQITQLYHMFRYAREAGLPGYEYAEDHIHLLASQQRLCTNQWCLKPKSACDLFLHARRTKYQSTMDRDDISVRRVPNQTAESLAALLTERIPLKDVYFARSADKTKRWQVKEEDDEPHFSNVVLAFNPSAGLKALAIDALGYDSRSLLHFENVEAIKPEGELLYAPFAYKEKATNGYGRQWPNIIDVHIEHWQYNTPARTYAELDVKYTRELYKYFGSPQPGDLDSELAICVACCRWKGYAINREGIQNLREGVMKLQELTPTAPAAVRKWLSTALNATEQVVIAESTDKQTLEELASWKGHPVAAKAKQVLDAREAHSEQVLYDKLLWAGRLHASFKVIGTLSGRMAGADKLNPQGIKREKYVRKQFPLADPGLILTGGDFDSFEVNIAAAVYKDPKLTADLESGKKFHGLLGQHIFPDLSYDDIMKSKGSEQDFYAPSKGGTFAFLYGGDAATLERRLGIELAVAEKAYDSFCQTYPGIAMSRKVIYDLFCTMRQPNGIGSKVYWKDPQEFVESIFGFRRYFTLENSICKALFDLSNKPPKEWVTMRGQVRRRDRLQSISGATRTALLGAAFGMQAAVMRAAANHQIQSSGAQMTKEVQRRLWNLQPQGVGAWVVQPMNVHDEIMCPVNSINTANATERIVKAFVEEYKQYVPLLRLDWEKDLKSWADK
jgi:hypothetical protein